MKHQKHKNPSVPPQPNPLVQLHSTISNRPEDVEAQISFRAYHLYVTRGREPGHALDDWLQAEREVMRERIAYMAM